MSSMGTGLSESREVQRSMRIFAGLSRRKTRSGESGYVLIGVLFLVFLFTLSLTIAVPQMAKSIQRDREMETIQRGKAYMRAIRLYYKVFGKYPSSVDELEKANNIRFLRRRYLDPMTGKDDWRLIHMGEAKVPSLGLFGVPAGIAQPSPLAGSLGPPIGQAANSADAAQPPINSISGVADPGAPPATASAQSVVAANAATPAAQSAFATDSANSIVVGQIVGVGIPVNKASLLNFKKQNNYSRWEFVYDPRQDQPQIPNAAGQGINQPNQGGGGPVVSNTQGLSNGASPPMQNGEPIVSPISDPQAPQ